MKHLLTLFLVFSFIFSFAQQSKIDSLKVELNKVPSNIEKLNILEPLSKLLINYSSPDASLPFFNQMSKISKRLNNHELETKAYRYISECYIKKQDFSKAELFATKALIINDSLNITKQYLLDINQLGRVYHHFQKYKEAIETYRKGIKQYDKHPEGKAISTIYSNLGTAYGEINEKEKQIEAFIKSAETADKLQNYSAKISALYGIGYVHMNLEQYEKAEKYFFDALKDSSKVELKTAYINMNYHALGILYSRWDKYQKALKYDNLALNLYKSVGNKLYEFDVLNNIAIVHSKMNQQSEVIEYAKKALAIAKEIDHKLAIIGAKLTLSSAYIELKEFNEAEKLLLDIAKDTINIKRIKRVHKPAIFQNLASVYEGKRNYKKSLKFYKRLKSLNDSILIDNRDSNITEIETKYQTEKKENENLQLIAEKAEQTLQLQKESTQKWYLGGGLGVSLITLGIFGFYYQRNKKQKDIIETLQKDLHHRVKNNLAIINRFIDVVKEEFNNEAFDTKLLELQNRITSINKVHEQLYNNEDATKLGVKRYIEKLKQNIESTYLNKNITVEQHIDDSINLKADKSFPLALIVNEFLTNSFKYAFNETDNGKIEIIINETDTNYNLELKDNGIGFPKGFDGSNSRTFGLRIMKLLTLQINGTFNIDGSNGVKLTIQFPK